MNTLGAATASAVTFTWLGMVLAISFLEAPLKFRAPGVTIPIGLGIGRLVFRALNLVEAVLAAVVVVAVALSGPSPLVAVLTAVVAVLLALQLGVVRPRLNRRSDRVLAGEELPRSRGHLYYVALEAAKVIALLVLGIGVLAH
jgi:Flp pilus assembly protein TadB